MNHDRVSDPFALVGATIDGKYRVDAVVGAGGFGVVYRGIHPGFGEPVALKCLKVSSELGDREREQLLDELRSEGRTLHRLSRATSAIVQALDVGAFTTDQGTWVPYLVLEWLEGETLASFLASERRSGRGGMSLAEAIALLDPIARALGVAHAMNVAHRDVKPANVFVTDVGGRRTMKLLDFGIAKALSDTASFHATLATTTGKTVFTPRYGAPEQFNKNRGASGPWTDVFALALLLVELVVGESALAGDDPTDLYIAAADPSMRPTLRGRGARVPDAVERVVDKALAVEPKLRHATASAFWDELREAVQAESAAASSPSRTTPETKHGGAGEGPARHAPRSPSDASDDPMVETRLPERAAAKVAPPPAPQRDVSRPARQQERKANVALVAFVWIALGAVGSGAGYYILSPHVSPSHPNAIVSARPAARRPSGSVARLASAAPTASVSSQPHVNDDIDASAAPSASADAAGAASGADASSAPDAATAPDGATARTPKTPPLDMVLFRRDSIAIDGGAERDVRSFYLDRLEVTVRAYAECVAKAGCPRAERATVAPPDSTAESDAGSAETWSTRCNASRGASGDPVNCVDAASAERYCAFRGRRLPTDGEWDIAFRGASTRLYPWGADAPRCEDACFDRGGSCREGASMVTTCASGSHPRDRTPEGIFDLSGNVAEWVKASTASLYATRGGSFLDRAEMLRAAPRFVVPTSNAAVVIGFRCAMDALEDPRDP
jgi:serine/threonine-protein kinase